MKKNMQGFTLIELMIVIAILGILLAIAIPAYQDYLARARASEAMLAGAPVKAAISEFRLSNNAYPTTLAEAGYTATANQSKYVASVTAGAAGAFSVTARGTSCPGGEPTFTFTPNAPATGAVAAVDWACTSTNVQCAPATCRTAAAATGG